MEILKNIIKVLLRLIRNSEQLTIGTTYSESNITIDKKEYIIPEKYSNFPKYNGEILWKPVERKTNNYDRIRITYAGHVRADFIAMLLDEGFVKGSEVRYDRGNTYVIVEADANNTVIVYHIKK